jgi:carbonic anhydrase
VARPANAEQAWGLLKAGNSNFVAGTPAHPRQDADIRVSIANKQKPFAALFGCSDSRLAAEMIFDVGLGDLFVVRNAGQVIAETILGSLEFAVEVLGVPLILVLGHDECGAVRSAMQADQGELEANGEFIHNLVARILPTVQRSKAAGETSIDEVSDRHIRDTIEELLQRSKVISEAVAAGRLAVVGANYRLELGEVHEIVSHGQL